MTTVYMIPLGAQGWVSVELADDALTQIDQQRQHVSRLNWIARTLWIEVARGVAFDASMRLAHA